MRKSIWVLGCLVAGLSWSAAVESGSATVKSTTTAPPAPSLIRLEGTVMSHDRQEYQLELQDAAGTRRIIQYNTQMRAYLRGHAIRWLEVKTGDSLVVIETSEPLQTVIGSRQSEESSGTVESVARQRQAFHLRTSKGVEEFINVPDIRIERHGARVAYSDITPGDSATVRYEIEMPK